MWNNKVFKKDLLYVWRVLDCIIVVDDKTVSLAKLKFLLIVLCLWNPQCQSQYVTVSTDYDTDNERNQMFGFFQVSFRL